MNTQSGFLSDLASIASDYNNMNHPHMILPTNPSNFINRDVVNRMLNNGTLPHCNLGKKRLIGNRYANQRDCMRKYLRQVGVRKELVDQIKPSNPLFSGQSNETLAWAIILYKKYGSQFVADWNAIGNPIPANYEMMVYEQRNKPIYELPQNAVLPVSNTLPPINEVSSAGAKISTPILIGGLGILLVAGTAFSLAKNKKGKK